MLPSTLIIKVALYGMNDPKVFQNAIFTPPTLKVSLAWDACKPASWLSLRTWFGYKKGFPVYASTHWIGMKDVLSVPLNGTLTGEPYVRSPPHPPVNDCLHLKAAPLLFGVADVADPCLSPLI